jgi:hypothetical protein
VGPTLAVGLGGELPAVECAFEVVR